MRVAAALLTLLCAALVPAPRGTSAPDPYGIFENAQAFWLNQQYPPYLSYDVAVTVDEGASVRTQRYASGFDATNGAIWVDPVSDYELAHPHVVHGMNFALAGVRIGKPEAPVDFFGVPVLAPTYTFGIAPFVAAQPPDSQESAAQLVAAVRRAFHDPYRQGRTPPPATGTHDQLPEIEHAVVTSHVYDITLAGEESVGGHLCYHLVLHPLRDPHRYRLRELWIDVQSDATWRLREALNFVDGPGTSVAWTVNFTNLAGAQYIGDENADAPVRYRGLLYRHVTIAFEGLRAVTVPDEHPISILPQTNVLREPLSQ